MEMLSDPLFWAGLGSITLINIVLSGDNAVVIALAARTLAPREQKRAIFWGSGAAVALRVILTLFAVALLGPSEPDIPALERMVSLGAAIQNMLLGAHALGYGTGLTSGQAMASPRLRALLELAEGDTPVCCINIGTVRSLKPPGRVRPVPAEFARILGQAGPS